MPAASSPKILLLLTSTTNNGTRVAKDLHDAGFDVTIHCSQHNLARALDRIRKIHPPRRLSTRTAILNSLRRVQPDFLIACDDDATLILHSIHATHPQWRPLIERSLGDPNFYSAVSTRAGLMQAISDLPGLSLPDWAILRSLDDLRAFQQRLGDAPFVLKAEYSAGGCGVRIIHHHAQAEAAFRQLTRLPSRAAQLARLLRDYALNVYPRDQSRQPPLLLAQRYIQGTPANTAIFCRNGEVLAWLGLEALTAVSEVSPCATVRRSLHPQMESASRAIAARLGLSGFHGIDFLLEANTSTPWLLELNPRVTPASHLPLGPGHDLIAACVHHLRPGVEFKRTAIPQPVIAFFPRQIILDPHNPHFRVAYHDIDWSAPTLVFHYLQRMHRKDFVGRFRSLIHWVKTRLRAA